MFKFRFLNVLALVTLVAASLGACAENPPPPAHAALETLPSSRSFSGSYLAGRFAQRGQDWNAAQNYMGTALSYDAGNADMAQRTFLLALGGDNLVQARALAQKISGVKQDGDELALIFMGCDALSRDDFAGAIAYLDRLPTEGFGQYTKPLLSAWAMMGKGDKAGALKILATGAHPEDPAYQMHAGMMEEFSGDMNAAAEHYKAVMSAGLGLHTAVMVANFFERYGQPEISRQIYQGLDKAYPYNPFIGALLHKDPHRAIAPNITRPADGAALALFDLATLLYEKRAYDSAQVYSGLVQVLDPQSPFASMMTGDIAALHGQFDKALADYGAIGAEQPIYWLARVRMTEVYEVSGRTAESIAMLTALSHDEVTRVPALVSLGDVLRRQSRYEEAIKAYNDALEGVTVTQAQWPIIYARGMAEERTGRWALAEKDLTQALSYQPDNPMILNFLAYSWANQGVNLDKALAYAKHAAALKPDDGYILDSYGWTLFRLSQYKESANWLEQAVAQIPTDSTLLDHLGDAYWQLGRRDEARFQWKHAHDLTQDQAFKTSIEQKIQHGIALPSQSSQSAIPGDAKL